MDFNYIFKQNNCLADQLDACKEKILRFLTEKKLNTVIAEKLNKINEKSKSKLLLITFK